VAEDDDFNKPPSPKRNLPFCSNCGMMTIVEPVYQKGMVSIDSSGNVIDNLDSAWCPNCSHWTNNEGECVSQRNKRCVTCQGRPRCESCGRATSLNSNSELESRFRCDDCDHWVDDDGNFVHGDERCTMCSPYSCNHCDIDLSGELDSDDEIHCDACDHFVGSDGYCVSTNRGHCSTCDGEHPICPGCSCSTSDNYYQDDDDDWVHHYDCNGECSHPIDSYGACLITDDGEPCTDCNSSCSSCDNRECKNGSDCDFRSKGNCNFCHCYHEDLEEEDDDDDDDDDSDYPSCNQCGDANDVSDPGGSYYWCDHCNHDIDSSGVCVTNSCDTCD